MCVEPSDRGSARLSAEQSTVISWNIMDCEGVAEPINTTSLSANSTELKPVVLGGKLTTMLMFSEASIPPPGKSLPGFPERRGMSYDSRARTDGNSRGSSLGPAAP